MCPCSLDSKEHVLLPLWSFQGARELGRPREVPPHTLVRALAGLSKLNSVSRLHRRLNEGGQSTEPASRSTLFQASRLIWTARRPSTVARHEPSDRSTEPTPTGVRAPVFPRKEVIQPQLPLRLPCYDFTPIINPTFDGCLLAVSSPASGIADFRGVTGGVYKPRVRIHRGVADPRLLATPPS